MVIWGRSILGGCSDRFGGKVMIAEIHVRAASLKKMGVSIPYTQPTLINRIT